MDLDYFLGSKYTNHFSLLLEIKLYLDLPMSRTVIVSTRLPWGPSLDICNSSHEPNTSEIRLKSRQVSPAGFCCSACSKSDLL